MFLSTIQSEQPQSASAQDSKFGNTQWDVTQTGQIFINTVASSLTHLCMHICENNIMEVESKISSIMDP